MPARLVRFALVIGLVAVPLIPSEHAHEAVDGDGHAHVYVHRHAEGLHKASPNSQDGPTFEDHDDPAFTVDSYVAQPASVFTPLVITTTVEATVVPRLSDKIAPDTNTQPIHGPPLFGRSLRGPPVLARL
jgi:hypothetical protein